MAGGDEVDELGDLIVLIDPVIRVVAVLLESCDLILGVTEDEAVFSTGFLLDFHVCTVEGTHRERTVDHELHVTCAAGLKTGS